jgi:protein phosphatase
MGTTLSVMVLIKNRVLIAHVGDSRIYRLRRNVLEKLTEDHTFAQIFLQKGYITPNPDKPERIATKAQRHKL